MNKKGLRQLALGFLISAIILSIYALATPEATDNAGESETQTSEAETSSSAQASKEETNSTETEAENETSDKETEDDAEESSSKKPKRESSEESSTEVTEITVTVNEGDSSDVVVDELAASGIISDRQAFYTYLNDNGFDLLVKPGNHKVNSDMSFDELAQALTSY